VAFCCTDAQAPVAQILEAVADRSASEQAFKDLQEVHRAGQQQVRNYWANVAAYQLNRWLHTLAELWAWGRSPAALCDRSGSPWDDTERRPAQAERCKALRRECLEAEIQRVQDGDGLARKFRGLVRRLLNLVV
jgi:hypothetical protein